MPTLTPLQNIKHVFVLVLENRSFDHMLGFSGITGTDAATGGPTAIDGLTGAESNTWQGAARPAAQLPRRARAALRRGRELRERGALSADHQRRLRLRLCEVAPGGAGRRHAVLHAGPGAGDHGPRAG